MSWIRWVLLAAGLLGATVAGVVYSAEATAERAINDPPELGRSGDQAG